MSGISGAPASTTIAVSGESALTGNVTLSAGEGVTLTQDGQDIEIAAQGSSPQARLEAGKDSADDVDDEFSESSLDEKWTVVSGSSGTVDILSSATQEIYDLATRSGDLLTQISSNNEVTLRQDWTLGDGESIVLAFTPGVTGTVIANNEFSIGISLNDDDSARNAGNYIGLFYDAQGAATWRLLAFDGSTLGEFDQVPIGRRIYLRVTRSTLTYTVFYSFDGTVWCPCGSNTPAGAYDNLWVSMRRRQ